MKSKPKILVVDDESRNLRLMEAMLIPLDYEVVLARDGIEVIDRVWLICKNEQSLSFKVLGAHGSGKTRTVRQENCRRCQHDKV